MDLGDSDTLTITWTPDDVARNCEYVSSISVTDSNDNAYDYLTVTHTGETFTTSGTSTVTGDASTSITAQNSDIGSYTVTYTMTDTSNSNLIQTTTVNLKVTSSSCLNSWNMPTTAWTDDQFILDLVSETSVTITWTADSNARDCDYDSSVEILSGGTVYSSFV